MPLPTWMQADPANWQNRTQQLSEDERVTVELSNGQTHPSIVPVHINKWLEEGAHLLIADKKYSLRDIKAELAQ